MKHALTKTSLAVLTAALALGAGTAAAQSTQWIAGTGNWFIPTNWTLGVPVANGSTLANYLNSGAFVSNGGTVILNSAGATASFVDMNGPTFDPGRASTLDVSGAGRLSVSSIFQLANSTLNIHDGGQASITGSAPFGFATGVNQGHITVTGSGSYFHSGFLDSGVSGSSLVIQNGGRVDSNGASIGGVAVVTGLRSAWSFGAGAFGGTFIVSASAGADGSDFLMSGGTTLVTGPGSVLRSSTAPGGLGRVDIGYYQTATLAVTNGGVVRSDSGVIGHQVYPGTPTGVVNISDVNSAWLNAGLLEVGGDHEAMPRSGSGTINVSKGGLLDTATSNLGNGPSSFGKVTVDGIASRWLNSGDVAVGNQSIGIVEVTGGATMRSARGYVGFAPGSNGSVSVTGPFSSWIASGSQFVGNGGVGQINVGDQGVVTTAGNAYLGFGAGSQGVANVSGAGSTWNVNGAGTTLAIGGSLVAAGGSGTLEIGDDGTVNAREVMLYKTGAIGLLGNAHLNGHITSDGGLIATIAANTLDSDITLKGGGLFVRTGQPTSVATFNGSIDGTGGLVKNTFLGSGNGTLILTGANTYTGATVVDAGKLVVDGSGTSATTIDHGTLAGHGTIAAKVTIGDGLGTADALLSPGNGIGRLTTGDLAFRADSVFDFQVDSGAGTADNVKVVGGVDIGSGASFVFGDLGSAFLAFGTSFVALDNDGVDAILGRFANLADGAVFDEGVNWFKASYFGGTGNDLVFTTFDAGPPTQPPGTVPEPSTVALLFAGFGLVLRRGRRVVAAFGAGR